MRPAKFRSKTSFLTEPGFWLFEIELESRCQEQSLDEDQAHKIAENGCNTTSSFHVQARMPFLRRKWSVRLQNNSPGFGIQLKVYNVLPTSSPVFDACAALDLPRMQELFRKEASPYDYCYADDRPNESTLDIVISSFCDDEASAAKYIQGVTCIGYLLTLDEGVSRLITPFYFPSACGVMLWEDEAEESFLGGMRLLLSQVHESPFQYPRLEDIASWITIKRARLPLASFSSQQHYHNIELEQGAFNIGIPFCENDRTMLLDLEGANVRQYLRLGREYMFCYEDLNSRPANRSTIHTMYVLIFTAKHSVNPKVVLCCKNRLALLIQHKLHQSICTMNIAQSTRDRFFDSFTRVLPLEYALQLGLSEFMDATLLGAGLDNNQIVDLFDEFQYAGIPELLDGILQYTSQRTCRKQFILDLLHGRFHAEDKDNDARVREIAASIGVPLMDRWFTERLIEYASQASRLKTMPGSWINEEEVVLIPKVDFPTKYCINLARTIPERIDLVDIRGWLKYEDEA